MGYWSGLALCLTKVKSSRARCPATALIPEAFNLYDIDKNGFITMKKMTDIIDAISSMVENTKMKICQRKESGRGFRQMEMVSFCQSLSAHLS